MTKNLRVHQSELSAIIYKHTKYFPFQIVYKDGLLYVYASNEESRSQWLKALQKGNSKKEMLKEKGQKKVIKESRFLRLGGGKIWQ